MFFNISKRQQNSPKGSILLILPFFSPVRGAGIRLHKSLEKGNLCHFLRSLEFLRAIFCIFLNKFIASYQIPLIFAFQKMHY